MLKPVRVVLAEDSPAGRRIAVESLSRDDDIQVVGAAVGGPEAVAMCRNESPDVVVLDAEMRDHSGLKALTDIRRDNPTVPVIMLTSLTVRGGHAAFDAMHAGAADFATRPPEVGHFAQIMSHLQTELVPRVRYWGGRPLNACLSATGSTIADPEIRTVTSRLSDADEKTRQSHSLDAALRDVSIGRVRIERNRAESRSNTTGARVEVVSVGASTAGTAAMSTLISRMPVDFPVPIVVTHHLPSVFTSPFAERLDRISRLSVRRAADGTELLPGHVWLAAGDSLWSVFRCGNSLVTRSASDAHSAGVRCSNNSLFQSIAMACGEGSIAVILAGTCHDGVAGCSALAAAGATVLAQDQSSSLAWDLPGAVVEAGLADATVSLDDIPAAITNRLRRPFSAAAVS